MTCRKIEDPSSKGSGSSLGGAADWDQHDRTSAEGMESSACVRGEGREVQGFRAGKLTHDKRREARMGHGTNNQGLGGKPQGASRGMRVREGVGWGGEEGGGGSGLVRERAEGGGDLGAMRRSTGERGFCLFVCSSFCFTSARLLARDALSFSEACSKGKGEGIRSRGLRLPRGKARQGY